jgi:1,4-dihydroxy-2-naphthoyl-CoA hydrolase
VPACTHETYNGCLQPGVDRRTLQPAQRRLPAWSGWTNGPARGTRRGGEPPAVRQELLAPNGFLHAASVIALADTSAGYGCVATLPTGASGFTTIELKSNFLGTAREGAIACRATPVHLGRTTQVWDARVTVEGGDKVIALFRCTQMVLWQNPKP